MGNCSSAIRLLRPWLAFGGVVIPTDSPAWQAIQWLTSSGLRILLIALVVHIVVRTTLLASAQWEKRLQGSVTDDGERTKRARTLTSLARNVVVTAVLSVAVLTVLRDLGIDVMPIVTGAGILGLAVGFGAQTLVRDVISGFFLIFDNNLRVGDVAVIDGTGGIVEAINLRTTVIRDLEGTVHVFPNGSFERFSNRTKDFSYYLVDVGVAYKEDTDRVTAILEGVGRDLASEARFAGAILAPLEVLGVDAFEDSQVTIKARIKTLPLRQWDVGRELRRRIKHAFDREGIEIPFPHMSVYFGEASRSWKIESTTGEIVGDRSPRP
jgi:small conductance mechanosensitive channel